MHLSLVLLIVSLPTPTFSIPGNFQLELTHVDYGRQLTKLAFLNRAALRSEARAKLLSSKSHSNPYSGPDIPFRPSGGLEYVLELSIGTPPIPYPLLLDTGSGLVWTQGKPCSKCVEQPTSLFNPSKSSTFSLLPCSDKLCQVLDQKNCTKNHCSYYKRLENHRIRFVTTLMPIRRIHMEILQKTPSLWTSSEIKVHVAFGCGTMNGGDLNNSSGIAGFSTAPTSFVSQLGVPGFSYCMTDDINKKTLLRFGTQEEIFSGIAAPVQTTNFVKPLQGGEGLYFVVMTGITVGIERLNIPKLVFAQGTIVDSGTALTQLPEVAFNKLGKVLFSKLKVTPSNTSAQGLDYCYSSPSMLPSQVQVPKVILHFEGLDLKLERNNYIYDDDEEGVLVLDDDEGGLYWYHRQHTTDKQASLL